jgi:hypothetical protein
MTGKVVAVEQIGKHMLWRELAHGCVETTSANAGAMATVAVIRGTDKS